MRADIQGATSSTPPTEESNFAALEVGREYGVHTLTLTPALVEDWCRLYGAPMPTEQVPAGMLSVISIRAFMATIPVRPPGGVHAGQRFSVHALPRVNERVNTRLRCAAKDARNGRLWVRLEMLCTGADERPLFDGEHIALWAR
ncbi:MAG: hypothetical protein WBC18_23745 [Ottowia sp.]|uniref:hypothetical protein n=1 Tax=Ottowia sp. TaxID=1898956 RepID=UPI003C75E6D8